MATLARGRRVIIFLAMSKANPNAIPHRNRSQQVEALTQVCRISSPINAKNDMVRWSLIIVKGRPSLWIIRVCQILPRGGYLPRISRASILMSAASAYMSSQWGLISVRQHMAKELRGMRTMSLRSADTMSAEDEGWRDFWWKCASSLMSKHVPDGAVAKATWQYVFRIDTRCASFKVKISNA